MLRRINQALPELLAGIVLYGILIQGIGIWFVDDKIRYSTGLWAGIFVAMGMAVNMAVVIFDTVEEMAQGRSSRRASLFAALRYLAVVVAFGIVGYFKLGNVIVMFVGVMGLKISAYLQPLTHKFLAAFQEKYFHRKS